MKNFNFTSESVGEGHPDKICDLISDSILDECLKQDIFSRVAVDVCVKGDMVVLVGEVTSKACVDYEKVARSVLKDIGYVDQRMGMDYKTARVIVNIQEQSPDISQGLERNNSTRDAYDLGAGDQGIMFGYATDETEERMPLTVVLSHRLAERLEYLRKSGEATFLRPDCKTQVTIEYKYEGDHIVPRRVHTVVISTQHTEEVDTDFLKKFLKEAVISQVIPEKLLDNQTIFHLQPSGRFVIGGPQGDSGLTGRKIIVDTYGGWGAHGGGAFSGKDWSKVDRSGAYAARWIAKSLVDNGLCRRALVQVSYAIGIPEPLSIFVDTYNTSKLPNEEILKIIQKNFSLRLGDIVKELDLTKPIYKTTAKYGHFGKNCYTWETSKKLEK
ncbi:S-adenosylmethionine synthase isoform type-2 [Nosema granulosis]|uniref:S-adenosylmethionine synthase n=1 Tax=Nosema granulosis TaxID=83296 RepID=A0A9P6GZ03_9MICR|nr:S-adenosylmethionine synthase isoform type-2 [Nosema granulosis]